MGRRNVCRSRSLYRFVWGALRVQAEWPVRIADLLRALIFDVRGPGSGSIPPLSSMGWISMTCSDAAGEHHEEEKDAEEYSGCNHGFCRGFGANITSSVHSVGVSVGVEEGKQRQMMRI